MDGISKPMLDCLDWTEWGMKNFGAIITSRTLPLAVMRKCIAAGLCRENGMGPVCDADGFIQETRRERMGYVLTDKGRQVLEEARRAIA